MQNQQFIIAKEGFKFILLLSLLTLVSMALGLNLLSWLLAGLTIFVTCFFRNPNRVPPQTKNAIISPADGKICLISEVQENRFLKERRLRVSIFMSVFNCHMNRSPLKAKVLDQHYHPGKFHFANVDKASELNEQNALLLEDDNQNKFVVVQIAGWVARRIVSYAKKGDLLLTGQRFGLIQFGSRVDVYVPLNTDIKVKLGQKVTGGLTILGELQ